MVLGATAALADGLPRYGSIKDAPAPYVAPFSWTGFYVGVNAGAGIADGSGFASPSPTAFGAPTPAQTADRSQGFNWDGSGFLGGLQAGYNWQSGTIVFGVEADIQSVDMDQSNDVIRPLVAPGLAGTIQHSHSQGVDWFGTVRARLGFAIQPMMLIYATGGLAYGETHHSHFVRFSLAGDSYAGSNSDTKAGWTVGGGAELALDRNWTVKAEYLYVDLGSSSYSSGTSPIIPNPLNFYNASYDTQFHVIRAGINYKF